MTNTKATARIPLDTLKRIPRAERRQYARKFARTSKKAFRGMWEKVWRLPVISPAASIPVNGARPVISPAVAKPSLGAKCVWHPTKGFRNRSASH